MLYTKLISLKKLFRTMSLESIILVFKNILLEKGLYFIGRNPRTAFDIIEAISSLIYPLKWEFPKILVDEANYSRMRQIIASSRVPFR